MTEWSIKFQKFLINAHHVDSMRMRRVVKIQTLHRASCPPLPRQRVFLPLKLWARAEEALYLPVWGKSMKIYFATLWWLLYSPLAQSNHPKCWRTKVMVGLLPALALLLGPTLLLDTYPGANQKPKVLLVSNTELYKFINYTEDKLKRKFIGNEQE